MARKSVAVSWEFLTLAAAAVVVIWVYAAALAGPFEFDDEPNITENVHIRVRQAGAAAWWAAAFQSPLPNRPVANLSFALNHYVNGYNPVGYRFINIIIHIINGFLLFGLAKATFQTPAVALSRREAGTWASLAAAVWLLHPLHTQSVIYVVQRMTSMATLFYLLSLLCYAYGRLSARTAPQRRALFTACAGSGLLALGTKEIAATLPAFFFLYEWYFCQDLDPKWLRRRLPVLAAVLALTAAIAMVYLRGVNPLERISLPYADSGLSMAQRVLTQFRVVVFYISLLIWPSPSRLNLDHDFIVSHSLLDPATTLASLLFLTALAAAAVVSARRHRLFSYAILWFLGNLVIESSLIRLENVFEHRTYLPSVMPAAAFVALLASKIPSKRAVIVVLCAIAALFGVWTHQRSLVWSDDIALWQDCLHKSPAKARPYNNLGSALVGKNRLEEAIPYFIKATQIKPEYGDAFYNLGYAYLRIDDIESGIASLKKAVNLEPENYLALNNLGIGYLMKGDDAGAARCFEAALRLKPDFASSHNNLGVALKRQGLFEEAVRQYREAIQINPDYAEAYNNLGVALKEAGQWQAAKEEFQRALHIQPDYPTARKNLEDTEAELAGKK
jgi:tetratricopeptide (TPR) repeat protein